MQSATKEKIKISKPTFIDLFCGAGLLSYAFKSKGFRPVYAVDLDAKAVNSYRNNVSQCAEVADVNQVQKFSGIDAIIAGPPCQGFSTLGRRDPKDARNELGLSILKWSEINRPKTVIVENVPGFINSSWFTALANGLQAQGYTVQVLILDAVNFGVAQKRRRAFTIASRIGEIKSPKPRNRKPRTFREVVLSRPIKADDPMHIWPEPGSLAKSRFEAIPYLGGKRDLIRLRPDLCPPSWKNIPDEATDVWGRIDPDQPTNTVRCSFLNPSKGRYIHPFEDRVLSLREGARLQGIPDNWVLSGEPTPIARQIGNGVPISLGKAIAIEIMKILEKEPLSYADHYSAAA